MRYIRQNLIMVFFVLLVGPGCALFGGNQADQEKTRAKIEAAQKHVETIRSLEVADSYPEKYEKAKSLLKEAQKAQDSFWGRKNAYAAASECITLCQQILRDFYLNNVAKLAQKMKAELKETAGQDPENPLLEYESELDQVIEKAEQMKTQTELVSLEKVIQDLEGVLEITYSIRTSLSKTLESDVSFGKGKYDLSSQGKKTLDEFLKNVIGDRRECARDYPNKLVVTKVKVVGYTDKLDFESGTPLVKTLIEKAKTDIPDKDPRRREALNLCLSRLRADTIGQYIRGYISENQQKDPDMKVETEILGRGEAIPAGITPPYPTADPRRRICKLYIYTTIR